MSWSSLRERSCATAPRQKRAFDVETRGAIGANLATTLAQLHDVDVDEVGLGNLARHEGYIERQVNRWRTQFEQMKVDGVDHETVVDEVGDELARSIPEQQKVAVVHGDYRLDNTVLDEKGGVRAILDWEICTLGDPMADVGVLLVLLGRAGRRHANAARARANDRPGLR